ncbi:glutamate synthase (NADPH) GltB3 subunit [Methanospirillum hungatei JF-1]|jgi:glutamate synthase domain-containing protein 3|uniref:Glutamate synthase (NADPH) GltB3 subunit n=1 Tax=Methanospirillum hungatei JF-1 (strain ATCC 27890 / DSM 864 / NBRC 100397 / JF-1) TaxID=323259 RepID=Q2FQ43_METHJ|nr:hypothetical protein [Methanospirillum hungatei]ABD40534.1 glutamate synthase (NADPH) GltB3 subunit [Methanospirillum hungatei JF-1]MBP9008126.1 hypothetical protein [Methanospirillum sp.]OQA60165.1 MAG: Tungsten-containing formylmethanofuran dehydrogenase 2 subunit C [Euryarchaeota archaeon ADurb.Bin294]
MTTITIDAAGIHYTPLNKQIRQAVRDGVSEIILKNVMGQRFIGDGLIGNVKITIHGVPGGDLGMFMKGPTIEVFGNADHAPGNTMDEGTIIIHGASGDATAHSMRGGKVFIRDDIGYRGGIHMKQYQDKRPVLIIGGTAKAFLGEYMAGGLVIMFRMQDEEPYAEMGLASGIHGGEIFIRGSVEEWTLGIGSSARPATSEDIDRIKSFIFEFSQYYGNDPAKLMNSSYTRIAPVSARPFAGKYTWE